MAFVRQNNNMKHYLITWSVRDGENEYTERQIINSKQTLDVHDHKSKIFKWLLKEFYMGKVEFAVGSITDDIFSIEHDYRVLEQDDFQSITTTEKKVLTELNIVQEMDYIK